MFHVTAVFKIFLKNLYLIHPNTILDKRHVMFSRGLLLILLRKLCMINIYVDRS